MLTSVGRRTCVGFNIGANNIWIAAACILYCFDIEQDPVRNSADLMKYERARANLGRTISSINLTPSGKSQ